MGCFPHGGMQQIMPWPRDIDQSQTWDKLCGGDNSKVRDKLSYGCCYSKQGLWSEIVTLVHI